LWWDETPAYTRPIIHDENPEHIETTMKLPPPQSGQRSHDYAGSGGPSLPRQDHARWPADTMIGGRFRVNRLLGVGGMGEVYLVEDERLGRSIAIKVLSPELARDPQFLKRFRDEARAASALNHPHVCVVHEVGELEDGSPFIAMELIQGETLDARLRRGSLPIQQIVEVAIQIVGGLDAAHSKGIVHRDIKPSNISLSADGWVKILDFGLSKRGAEGGEGPSFASSMAKTQSGVIMGTPSYMSPEQVLGRLVDHRSDIFSFGVVAYQLVTGRLPFPGSNVGETIEHILHAQPEAMARFNYELPPELDRIVRKCVEKRPERRYQTARDLLVDLKNLGRELEIAATTPSQGLVVPAAPVSDIAESLVATPDTRSLEELRKCDIFLSYASIDDQPVAASRQGWITQLNRNLKVRLEQLLGESVRMWPQANPLGQGEPCQDLLRQLPEVRTLVSVLSPPFVRSDDCRSQVSTFWRTTEMSGHFQVQNRPRMFKVVKTPVEARELPPDVAGLFTRLKSFDFFEWDAETGRLREFDEAFGDVSRQHYHERVYDVAYEISQTLKTLQGRGESVQPSSTDARVIYLAATTADLAAQRDQLQRELIELGHTVVPDRMLPVVSSDLESAVRSYLTDCHLAIHLIGDRYGLVPEDTDLSVVAFQNRLAAAESAARGLPRFIWMPRGLNPRDERQEAFVRDLVRDPEAHRGAEVVSDTLENFKILLRSRGKKDQAGASARAQTADGPPRVYLICDPRDEAAVEPVEDYFYERGVEVSLPGFEASEAEMQDIHIQNLRDCDGALIYYGTGGNHWVDFNIRELQKAAGYRGAVSIGVRAVLIAPPFNHRKDRFKSVSVDVIRQPESVFAPAVLDEFVDRLKATQAAKL
jgi:serine/threonine protein kinase